MKTLHQCKKGQVSIELLTTFGIVVAFTFPVLLLLLAVTQYGHENASMAQADATVRILADSIDSVYFEGVGAKKTVLLNLPSGTKSLQIKKNEIVLDLSTSSGQYQAATPFSGVIAAEYTETDKSGLLTVTLQTNELGKVQIS